eukprot:674669-Pyramimonas_sp.AAC.1
MQLPGCLLNRCQAQQLTRHVKARRSDEEIEMLVGDEFRSVQANQAADPHAKIVLDMHSRANPDILAKV